MCAPLRLIHCHWRWDKVTEEPRMRVAESRLQGGFSLHTGPSGKPGYTQPSAWLRPSMGGRARGCQLGMMGAHSSIAQNITQEAARDSRQALSRTLKGLLLRQLAVLADPQVGCQHFVWWHCLRSADLLKSKRSREDSDKCLLPIRETFGFPKQLLKVRLWY